MIRKRLLNCDFINSGSFANISNDAKLLYLFMFASADDKGFCDNAENILESLRIGDKAITELCEKGLLYKFEGNHDNSVYLIRHWYFHNQYKNGLYTNYLKYLTEVELENNKYVRKPLEKETLKENKVNESKVNESKIKEEETIKEDSELPFDYS